MEDSPRSSANSSRNGHITVPVPIAPRQESFSVRFWRPTSMVSERDHPGGIPSTQDDTVPVLRAASLPAPSKVASGGDYSTVERCSSSEDANMSSLGGRSRAPNWSDAETRFLVELWRDRFPLSKRRNSSAWAAIAKQLNKLLAKHCLSRYRSGVQCKARIKYLEDQYKRVIKAHKWRNGNTRVAAFDYFEEMDAVFGCKLRNNPSSVGHVSGFNEEQPPLISSPIRSPVVVSEAGFKPNSGLNCEHPSFISPEAEDIEHIEPINYEREEDGNEVVAVAEPASKSAPRKKRAAAVTKVTRPPAKRADRSSVGESSFASSEILKFLEESQKRDHEFFRMLVEKERDRELERQKMMFDMVKEVAKIFKGEKERH